MNKRWLIPGGIVLLAAAAAVAWTRYTASPTYALREAANAIRTHDRALFERRVDVESLVRNVVDDLLAFGTASAMAEARGEGALTTLGVALGMILVEQARPTVVSALKRELLEAIEKGTTANTPAVHAGPGGPDVSPLLATVRLGPDDAVKLGPIRKRGAVATATLLLHDALLEGTLELRLGLERWEKGWVITRVENVGEHLREVERLQRDRLARENDAIEAQIAALLEVGPPHRSVSALDWYGERLAVRVGLTNRGSDTIGSVILQPRLDGRVSERRETMSVLTRIAPGQHGAVELRVDYNPLVEWHRALRYDDIELVPTVLTLRRGGRLDRIQRFANWDQFQAHRAAEGGGGS